MVGRGFIPGIKSTESAAASQAAEKLVRAVGRGFIPGINPAESLRASAPEACFSGNSPVVPPFSTAWIDYGYRSGFRRERGGLTGPTHRKSPRSLSEAGFVTRARLQS